ncbi:MAG: NUDIX hydrolase [Candidatus Lokiarchaeota archaeon]|nr:NUDIX hydrolase [Candidatus Lokiarchaeota archaeon]
MEEKFRFIYGKEYWYISAFINTVEFVGEVKAEEIEALLLQRLHNLSQQDLSKAYRFLEKYPYAEEKKEVLRDMAKSISIECDWEPFFQNFPYNDENKQYTEDNREIVYNTLGYFKLEVEYYKNEEYKKERISPDLIQQIPFIANDILKEYSNKKQNDFLLLDTESPIYVFVISNRIGPFTVQWDKENIEKYKKELGYWTRIYSGQWGDYSEELFERRIKKNFSNRRSELHYIQRNSGFIYIAEENYRSEFPYIMEHVIEPTPKVRAVLFALMTINNSLDILFMKRYSDVFMSLETIEKKTNNLRFLRGMIQTKMSMIYSELDWNPREHYTRILTHLLEIFRIEIVIKRVNEKFKILYDSMQEFYLQRSEKNQRVTRTILYLVNIILSAGIVKDFFDVLIRGTDSSISLFENIVYLIATSVIGLMFVGTLTYILLTRFKSKVEEKGYTADAVIVDDNRNVILIKRKYYPYIGKYALPGGFIKYNEDAKQAVIREVREETNLVVEIDDKIGTYDQKGRDPRGRIVSTAFKCHLVKDLSKMAGGDDATVADAIPIEKVKNMDLAFDHKRILKDAGVL